MAKVTIELTRNQVLLLRIASGWVSEGITRRRRMNIETSAEDRRDNMAAQDLLIRIANDAIAQNESLRPIPPPSPLRE